MLNNKFNFLCFCVIWWRFFSNFDYTASNENMISEWRWTRKDSKEEVVAYFKVLTRHLPGETEEDIQSISDYTITVKFLQLVAILHRAKFNKTQFWCQF